MRGVKWTKKEDDLLAMHWGYMPMRELAELVGRTQLAVYQRCRQLGVGGGCPNGFEYVSAAARRTGFDLKTLRRVLRLGHVEIRRGGAKTDEYTLRPRSFVESFEVDEAVKAWCQTEHIATAAARHGLSRLTLKSWLLEAKRKGVKMPAKPARAQHWRIPSRTIDAIVAEKLAGKERLAVAARRLDVPRQCLSKWLRSAGVPRPKTRHWLLKSGVADAVVAKRVSMKLPGFEGWMGRCA